MQHLPDNTEARERVLDAAEQLFSKKGYATVTLRDIAAEVGIRHTSLYHHAPGGKEALFIEVTERSLQRHREGLNRAISGAGSQLLAQLRAVADWLLSQPPMDLVRMTYSDMPAIDQSQAQRLSKLALDSLIMPIFDALVQAEQRGEIGSHDFGAVSGGLLGMIESLYAIPEMALEKSRQVMAYGLIDVLFKGLQP